MFNRINETYSFDPKLINNIFADEANPLNRISKIIHENAKVLDVGAGNGLLANVLRQNHAELVIDGIEPNQYATKLAKQYYRNFYTGYVQDFYSLIGQENYDYIVLADVIEHMQDPLTFLQELSKHIGATTKIVISTPNVAFGAVRIALMHGEFRYVDSGLLERTHLRFFTYETLLELGKQSGFGTLNLQLLFRDILGCEIKISPSIKNFFYLLSIAHDELAHVYQFLVVLNKNNQELPSSTVTKAGRKTNIVVGFSRAVLRKARNTVRNHIKGRR
jgi:2-polyprenyl-3-methyl-5-hydroxy-6-metoxy-1,4-benzoquinol methylase